MRRREEKEINSKSSDQSFVIHCNNTKRMKSPARQPATKTLSVSFPAEFLRSESHFSPGLAPFPPPIDSVECPALLLCINCWVIPSPGVIFRNPHNTARADILVQISLFTSPSRLHFLLRSSRISRSVPGQNISLHLSMASRFGSRLLCIHQFLPQMES